MNDTERYESICQPAFKRHEDSDKRIEDKIDSILAILKGKDDEPGLCERVRKVETALVPDLPQRLDRLEWFQKGLIGSVVVIAGAIFTQIGTWLWNRISGG